MPDNISSISYVSLQFQPNPKDTTELSHLDTDRYVEEMLK